MEELQARHQKEQRDLQSRITQKKKNATKKSRKGVNDECDALQRDLLERQQAEIAAADENLSLDQVDHTEIAAEAKKQDKSSRLDKVSDIKNAGAEMKAGNSEAIVASTNTVAQSQERARKPNRQKARLARRAADQDTQVAQAAEEAASLPDRRNQELEAMQTHFKKLGLKEISIRPDGHCLYSAIATQLPRHQLMQNEEKGIKPYQDVRETAADFISSHPDDFEPFLEEPLDVYTSKIKDSAEWGGQLELQAAARAYSININVLQADGRVENIESEVQSDTNQLIWLAYYRHSFGLGEHYNALEKAI